MAFVARRPRRHTRKRHTESFEMKQAVFTIVEAVQPEVPQLTGTFRLGATKLEREGLAAYEFFR